MLVTRYLANVQAYTRELNNVVVAKSEIPLGAKITAEQVAAIHAKEGDHKSWTVDELTKLP